MWGVYKPVLETQAVYDEFLVNTFFEFNDR